MGTQGTTNQEPDARVVYADIIDHPRWKSPTREPMSMYKRAAQFSPFDALDGYSDMITEEERVTEKRHVLDEYELEILNWKLNLIRDLIDAGTHPTVTFTVFVPDEWKDGGRYVEITDAVKRVDTVAQKVILMTTEGYGKVNRTIRFDCIRDVHGQCVDHLDNVVAG